jgi:ATP-binding cassette subfamily B protein/subfamily B ATP-binding cassette protein MsbA
VVGRAPFSVQIPIYESERIASNLLLVIVCLVSLVWLDYRLAIVAMFMGIIIAYSQRLLQSPISAASRKQLELSRQMGVSMLEDLQLLRLLHSSSSLFHSELHIRRCGKDLEKSMVRLSFFSQLLEPISELLPFLAITVIGAFSWIFYHGNGERLVPSLVVFVLIIQRLNSRLTSISSSLNRLAENVPSLEDLADVLNPAGKEFRRVGGLPFKGLFSRIDIEDVSFAYEVSDGPSLAHVNLRIPMGSKTALVGRSGSGKSTLMDLLVGLHAPTSGQIYVDGIDLQTLDLDQWQNHLGVVSQDVLLIHGSVSANIAFGLSGVGSDQIAEAARLADAEAFILDLPSGYDTVVGDRGMRLSGGQRQRLSLARALLRQPKLLILDEATSALDSLSETRILKTIKKVFSQITILSVAHRLSSISDADLIIVLDQGRVVEQGDHAELMQLNGLYATLWRLQATQSSSER